MGGPSPPVRSPWRETAQFEVLDKTEIGAHRLVVRDVLLRSLSRHGSAEQPVADVAFGTHARHGDRARLRPWRRCWVRITLRTEDAPTGHLGVDGSGTAARCQHAAKGTWRGEE